jgi:two-component system sensor histidine kinase DesK
VDDVSETRRRWWSWADRDQVDRVDVYTRQSLYVLLWSFAGLLGVQTWNAVPTEDRDLAAAVLVGGLVVTLAAHRVLTDVIALHPAYRPLPWRSLGPLLGLEVVGFLAILGFPNEVRGLGLMLLWSALAWGVGGLRDPRATVLLLLGLGLPPAIAAREPMFVLGGFAFGAFVVFTVRASLWVLGVVRELDRARETRGALAVAEERLRFSSDVHDVLGRRLSAIALQAELGATLARRGDPSAADRMLEVRDTAHTALAEARAIARGYRPTDLSQELDGARSLLRSAGIAVSLQVEGVPDRWHEAAAWVVREAVTNVLRHSTASLVEISYDGHALRVANDRPSPGAGGPTDGSGLGSLAARLAPLGTTLEVERDAERFAVVVPLPHESEVVA